MKNTIEPDVFVYFSFSGFNNLTNPEVFGMNQCTFSLLFIDICIPKQFATELLPPLDIFSTSDSLLHLMYQFKFGWVKRSVVVFVHQNTCLIPADATYVYIEALVDASINFSIFNTLQCQDMLSHHYIIRTVLSYSLYSTSLC